MINNDRILSNLSASTLLSDIPIFHPGLTHDLSSPIEICASSFRARIIWTIWRSSLFQPSGVDGVYGRTGEYESVVEALAALISRHRPEGRRSVPFSAGDEPRLAGEAGLSQKLSQSGRRRLLPGRQRTRDRSIRPTSMRWRQLDRRSGARRPGAGACRLLPGLSHRRGARRGAGQRLCLRCRRRLFPP